MASRFNRRPPSRVLGGGTAKAFNGSPGSSLIRSGSISAARLRGTGAGFTSPFFAPGTPQPDAAPPSVRGRAFDYPAGVNLTYFPRHQQGVQNISFEMLRRLADPAQGGLDLLRAAIEKRKKEMKGQRFKIVGREKNDDGGDRAKAAMEMLRKPDGRQRWRVWLGAFLEDHFVTDAPSVYFRPSANRGVLWELVDGATIDVLVDDDGRTPEPPLPAYQQVLKGLPTSKYTTEEMGYYAYNIRPGRLYGMGLVEQVATIVTIALNRQLSVLNYFTAGSVPDMLVGVPETWQPDQIAQWQEWWDSMLSGQLDERRHARFIPGQAKPYETKTEILKNEFDEWIARVICFCADLSPESLVRQTNRATAETGKESASEQGLEPTKVFVKDCVDDMLERAGAGDLELLWVDEEIVDPVEKATVAIMLRGGATGGSKPVITLDEQRDMMGLPPVTPDQREELDPEPPPMGDGVDPMTGAPVNKPAGKDDTTAAKRRGGRSLPAVPKNRKAARKLEKTVARISKQQLAQQRKTLLDHLDTFNKATEAEIRGLVAYLRDHPWDDNALGKLREAVAAFVSERSRNALDHLGDIIGGTDGDYKALLYQANQRAVEWARDRVSNLVTGIDATSAHALNEITSLSIEHGLTNGEIASLISKAYEFSPERSMLIARTETATADSQGSMIGYRESGVVTGKYWDPDSEACPICLGNADVGTIPLDDEFPSGHDTAPAHPNCECGVNPVVDLADV